MRTLCRVLVGRDWELAALSSALESVACDGLGRALFVVGEAGVGKTRLVREVAASARSGGHTVVWGRALASGAPDPYRPLVELVAGGLRRRSDDPASAPYRPALARLLPIAGEHPSPDVSPAVLLAEGILRLLAGVGVAVLEDLHWADDDTLGIVEYLADNIADAPVLLIGTVRADEVSPAMGLARSLRGRGSAEIIELSRLDSAEVMAMAAACLGLEAADDVPAATRHLLESSADGLPLLIEDLLATASEAGPVRSLSFADTVQRRLANLPAASVEVVHAAAVFGRTFAWELLPALTGLSSGVVLDALRAGVAAGLIETNETSDGGFSFRHALTAAAVLDGLLPPERAELSRRAADVVDLAHPAREGEWCVRAAELRAAAGDRAAAAELLLVAGRRAMHDGALASAAEILWRAAAITDVADDVGREVRLAQLEALLFTGARDEAIALGRELVDAFGPSPAAGAAVANVHLLLARGLLASDPAAAEAELDAAAGRMAGELAVDARIGALRAAAVMASDRSDRLEAATDLARRAATTAEAAGLVEVACEALEVMGRCARVRDLDATEAAFRRQLQLADSAGLALWQLRARNEVGTVVLLRTGDTTVIEAAHAAAVDAGAVVLAAGFAMNIVFVKVMKGLTEAGSELAEACEATARRLGAAPLADTALVYLALAAAVRGQRDEMETLLARAGVEARGDLAIVVHGLCRALCALLSEDRTTAHAEFEAADAAYRLTPPLMPDPFVGSWLLLRLVDGVAGEPDLHLLDRVLPGTVFHRVQSQFCRAVVAGRAGQHIDAAAALATGMREGETIPIFRHLYLRLVAEAAMADGWGEPAAWLLEVEAWSVANAHTALTSVCRRMLKQLGVIVGRQGDAESTVPVDLRLLGVTAREWDVLELVANGFTNREIGNRLYLSPRTVEKHVASLLAKLGVASRSELGSRAGTVG